MRVLRRSLSAHGYMVLVATSGEEAMEVVLQQRPDLLLLACQGANLPSSIAPNASSEPR